MSNFPSDYENRVYAGWLGKCIGVRFGAPVEGWTYQEIRDNLGELSQFFPLAPGKLFKPDDDTALPMLLIHALSDYGPEVSAAQLGEAWLNYLADQRGTLWWGGYGKSTEHTAYMNLAAGVAAPLSGSTEMNGAALAEQIGGQIFSDIWGLVIPDNPRLAADYAARAASVAHDGNGMYGGMFVAALVSHAFREKDPQRLVEQGLALIPKESEYSQVVTAVLEYYRQHPDDWHAAYRFIHDQYGYDRYPGEVPIIPNAAIVVMALLYGQGDFSRTIQIANMGGWDTDCNVGNAGAIMGVAVGLPGISDQWRRPMNDLLIAAGLLGARNLWTIPACADLFCRLGREFAGEPQKQSPRIHFQYPGSTQGFLSYGTKGRIMSMRQGVREDTGYLQINGRKLSKKGEARLFVKSSIRPDELSANYYGASFSPQIYPGQTVRARLLLPPDEADQLRAALYVWDDNGKIRHTAPGSVLQPGEWHELSYRIPRLHNSLLSEVGLVLRNLGDPWTGKLLLEWLDWAGTPEYGNDFALERAEFGAISQWTYLRGYWRLEDGAYHASGTGINESYTGAVNWRDYALSVRLRPLLGEHHHILVRVQGARRSYAIGLGADRQFVIYKNDGGYQPVTAVPFAWQHGQPYIITVHVVGNALTAAIEGGPVIQWVDEADPYLRGQIGFGNFAGCHTAYEAYQFGS